MNKRLSVFLILMLATSACGGRTAAPVMAAQYGDTSKNCKALEYEMTAAQNEMNRLLPKSDKTGQNVALGVAGAFLLVPWFFMDFKNAEQTEYEAYRQRYNNLASLAMSKNCKVEVQQYPSVDEMRHEYEKQQGNAASNRVQR